MNISAKWVFFWIFCMAATSGITWFVTDTLNKRKQAEALFAQSEKIAAIIEESKQNRESIAMIMQNLARLTDAIKADVKDAGEKTGESAALSLDAYSLLCETLVQIERRGSFKNSGEMCDNLEAANSDLQRSARETAESYREFGKSFSEAISGFSKRAELLTKFAAANIKKYRTMLVEIRELLKLPVKIDFDPNKDIKYVKKRLRQSRREYKALTELRETLADLKNHAPPTAVKTGE